MKKTTSIIITLLRTLADELEGVAGSPEQAATPAAPETPAPKKRGRPAAVVAEPQQVSPAEALAAVAQVQTAVAPPEQTSTAAGKALTYEDLRAMCMPMIKNPPHNEVVKTTIREFIPDDGGLKKLAEHPEHHSAFEAKIMAYRNENNLH